MKTWYRAVCDDHKEMIHIFVNNPICTAAYLGSEEQSRDIQAWLSLHYGCKLRLVYTDEELDEVLGNYTDSDKNYSLKRIKRNL